MIDKFDNHLASSQTLIISANSGLSEAPPTKSPSTD